MIYRNINLPLFSRIDKGIFESLSDIIKEENLFFKNVAILTGNYGEKLVTDKKVKQHFSKVVLFNIRKCSNISYIRSAIISQKTELILTIGGGGVNDIGKYVSMETSIPLISIPTVLSNDGIASPVSIIKWDGKYRSLGTTPPIGVIADIDIVAKAPKEFLLSGVGDLISNLSAVLDWNLAYKEIGEKIDVFAKNTAFDSAIKLVYNCAKKRYSSLYDEKFLEDLFNGLVMSAVAMIIAKSSRPASGAEHNISHAMDRLNINKLHGMQVGFATLFTLYLHNANETLEDVLTLYKHLKFPISFSELKVCEKKFIEALKLAPFIRNRYTVLNKFSTDLLMSKFYEFKRRYIK